MYKRRMHVIGIDTFVCAGQQQAPGKPMLRILSSAADPLALSFGSDVEKNDVLELIKQLRPNMGAPVASADASSRGIPTEAQKRKIFSTDRDLAVLYTQLVASGIISEIEFWHSHKKDIDRILAGGLGKLARHQRTGLSSVMHEVERLHDGSTERVSIQLTPQDIEKIFFERPEVHRAFLAHVPHSMTEAEFWQKYFKLEYKKAARRKRLASQGRLDVTEAELEDSDDIFAPFRKQLAREAASKARALVKNVDPTVDLTAEIADRYSERIRGIDVPHEERLTDIGRSRDDIDESLLAEETTIGTLESLAHEVNRHAAQVLEGAPEGLMMTEGSGPSESSGLSAADRTRLPSDTPSLPKDSVSIAARVAASLNKRDSAQREVKKGIDVLSASMPRAGGQGSNQGLADVWKDRARSGLEDLTLEEIPTYEPLEIADPRSYFVPDGGLASNQRTAAQGGITTTASVEIGGGEGVIVDVLKSLEEVDVTALCVPPCDASLAMKALVDLCEEDDMELVAEFGPSAGIALRKDPKRELTGVMLVCCVRVR